MLKAGTRLDVTVSYLRMTDNPGLSEAPLPAGHHLTRAIEPPVWYFLSLYQSVGRDWEWNDRFQEGEAELAHFVSDPAVELWTVSAGGWPRGFFQLDFRAGFAVDLAYFGLVPEAIGAGLGRALLQSAVAKAWSRPQTRKMTVNTCTLDHPSAVALYLSVGFLPASHQVIKKTLKYDRVAPLAEPA